MHYYQFNIGEYASHTRHLSPIEDLAYRRLLDLSYTTELPLTKDIRQLTRLVNLREYQQEVEDVLKEFYFETDDGWLNNRVIKEIERTGKKSESAKNSAAIRWDNERKAKKMQEQCKEHANASVDNANACENDATNNPIPNTNNPNTQTDIVENITSIEPTLAASVCLSMKQNGILDINPSHQTLQALLNAGAIKDEFTQAAIQAKQGGKGFSYALGIVKKQREEAAKLILHQGAMPNPQSSYQQSINVAAKSIFKPEYIAEQTEKLIEVENEPIRQIA